jgi:hypothetical protein
MGRISITAFKSDAAKSADRRELTFGFTLSILWLGGYRSAHQRSAPLIGATLFRTHPHRFDQTRFPLLAAALESRMSLTIVSR